MSAGTAVNARPVAFAAPATPPAPAAHASAWPAAPETRLRAPRVPPESLEDRRVLVIGGYGVGNLGDEAILAGLIHEHDLWDATVVSYDPGQTQRLHGVNAVFPFSAKFVQAFVRADHVLIGGGGLFSAYMGRFQKAMPLVGLAAQRLGKTVDYRAFGAYEGTPPLVARTLAFAVSRADHVSVRDTGTHAFLRGIGVRRDLEVVPDPAFALAPCSPERARAVLRQHVPGAARPFVALGVRRVKDPAEDRRLTLALAGLGTTLLEHGVTPLYVAFSRHPYEPLEDDAAFARDLVQATGGGAVLDAEVHPRDVLGIVREAAAMVAVRFHALVFALRVERPVVALPYDRKCADVLHAAGLPAALTPAEVTARELSHRVLQAMDRPAAPPGRGWPPADPGHLPSWSPPEVAA